MFLRSALMLTAIVTYNHIPYSKKVFSKQHPFKMNVQQNNTLVFRVTVKQLQLGYVLKPFGKHWEIILITKSSRNA